jgi:hypothetical protein
MKKELIFLGIILLAIFSYSSITFLGDQLNGPLIMFLILNAYAGNLFYGFLPIIGIFLMLFVLNKRNMILFTFSFLSQFVPLLFGIILNENGSNRIRYWQFIVPLVIYLVCVLLGFFFIKYEKKLYEH